MKFNKRYIDILKSVAITVLIKLLEYLRPNNDFSYQ